MVARAKAGTWFNLVAGLVVGAAASPLPVGAAAGGRPVAQLGGERSHARIYLDAGLDAGRRGDGDAADRYLRAAQARQAELSAAELDELGRALDVTARGQMPAGAPAPAGRPA